MADISEKKAVPVDTNGSGEQKISPVDSSDTPREHNTHHAVDKKEPFWKSFIKPGSAGLIIIAALLAIAIGVSVSATEIKVPRAATTIIAIPGNLWLRSLRAVVLPLIFTAIVLAMQRLKEMARTGRKLAIVTITYYVATTLFAIIHSTILTATVWSAQMKPASEDSLELTDEDAEEYEERTETKIEDVVVQVFYSFIPQNVVAAFADEGLLAVLVTAVVVGCLLRPGDSIVKAVHEIDRIVTKIITFLILLAPIGVFFLILPNLFKLDIATIGENLGFLIGGSLCGMAIHLIIVYPALFFAFTRKNPLTYWLKCSPAWVTAWGSASSAATMPVTLKMMRERGIPNTVRKFAIPLGTLINMDGTAIYFPVVVTFMARTQGITLSAANYVIIVLLSTLSSIATTPIPSSSLVLTVMIAQSVNVPLTGMYAVVVAIDWFLDRFRTALNVSGDMMACAVITKLTKIEDTEEDFEEENVGEVRNTV